jgi:putative tricarboxylic transport membrane protein
LNTEQRIVKPMKLHCLLLASTLSCLATALHAQGWSPQKNVEIVVPSAPGGTNDKLARQVERTLGSGKSTVAVVHKSGAGGQLAYAYLGPHAGDPHYLLIVAPTLLTAHITGMGKLNHTDFTPIATIFNDHMVFAVNPVSTIRTGKDLAAKLRADPQSMSFGFTSALGNHHHIAAGLFMKNIGAGIRELKPVVFKGSAEAITALLGNHIEFVSTGAANAAPHAAAGKLRVVGISAGQRLPGAMAAIPTWKEQGIDLIYGSWRAILAPRGLAPEQVAYWEGVLRKAVETTEWKAELERYYWSDYFATGAALRKNLEKEYADMKSVLVELGLVRQ